MRSKLYHIIFRIINIAIFNMLYIYLRDSDCKQLIFLMNQKVTLLHRHLIQMRFIVIVYQRHAT